MNGETPMSTPLRFIPEEAKRWKDSEGRDIAVAEVTIKTILAMYLLRPTERNKSLIIGVIARAKAMLDFELYGYAFLSNHGSMLMGVRSAEQLSNIMQYIHGNIARELGRKENSDWQGRFWGRRGRAILVLTDDDLIARMAYLLANSTKEHLVKHPARWPGAHCAKALCEGKPDKGAWISHTQLRQMRAANPHKNITTADATTWAPLELDQLPCWAHLTPTEYRQQIKTICHQIKEDAEAERQATGGTVVGKKRLLRYSPHHRPTTTDKSPAPPIHCRDLELRFKFIDAYRDFVDAYRTAHKRLATLINSPNQAHHPTPLYFPPGGIPPGSTWATQAH